MARRNADSGSDKPSCDLQWVTNGEGVNAWFAFNFGPTPIAVNQFVLYDRASASDNIRNCAVMFSSQEIMWLGPLNNDGSPTYFNFTTRQTDSLLFGVFEVSSTTTAIGLADFQIYNNPAAVIASPTAAVGAAAQSSMATIASAADAEVPVTSAASSSNAAAACVLSLAVARSPRLTSYVTTVRRPALLRLAGHAREIRRRARRRPLAAVGAVARRTLLLPPRRLLAMRVISRAGRRPRPSRARSAAERRRTALPSLRPVSTSRHKASLRAFGPSGFNRSLYASALSSSLCQIHTTVLSHNSLQHVSL